MRRKTRKIGARRPKIKRFRGRILLGAKHRERNIAIITIRPHLFFVVIKFSHANKSFICNAPSLET